MAKRKDSEALNVQAGNCPKCGKHNITAKYVKNKDQSITQTILCNDCGNSIVVTEANRYRAAKVALTKWGYAEGYGPAKAIKEKTEAKKHEPEKKKDVAVKKVETKKSEPKKTEKAKEVKPTFNSLPKKKEKEVIIDEKTVQLSSEKNELLKSLKSVIARFGINNPNEECPVTLGDLMKVYGFTNSEIASVLSVPKYKKKFLKSRQEVIMYLNQGISVYTRDREGTIFKYTPVCKLEDTQETADMFEATGLSNYAYIIEK